MLTPSDHSKQPRVCDGTQRPQQTVLRPESRPFKAAKTCKSSYSSTGPYTYFSHESTCMRTIAEWMERNPIPTKIIDDPDPSSDAQEIGKRTVYLSNTSWNEEEKAVETQQLGEWDARFSAFLDDLCPKDAPKAKRVENYLTGDGYTITTKQGRSDVFSKPYLSCDCPHFFNSSLGRLQASSCMHLTLLNGEDTETTRICRSLKAMLRQGYRPIPESKKDAAGHLIGTLVDGHIVYHNPEPKKSQFRWGRYKSCSCRSWTYANGSITSVDANDVPVTIKIREAGAAHQTMRVCKHLTDHLGSDVEYTRHTNAVKRARDQDWVPVKDRETGHFVKKLWTCTCPSYASEWNQNALVKKCKHIHGVHEDIDGVPDEKRGVGPSKGHKNVYVDADGSIALEDKFWKVRGSTGDEYLVAWSTIEEESDEEFQAKKVRFMQELKRAATNATRDEEDDDW